MNCGSWQNDYTVLHARILSGQASSRYAVAVAVEAGLTDNLVGVITSFFYAVLSDRAFQISTHSDLPDLADAYDFPNINITRHIADPEHLTLPVHFKHTGSRQYGPEVDASKYAAVYLVNQDAESLRVVREENLKHWPSGGEA